MRAGDGQEEGVVEMQDEKVKQEEELKYLGSTVQADAGSETEREIRKWIELDSQGGKRRRR